MESKFHNCVIQTHEFWCFHNVPVLPQPNALHEPCKNLSRASPCMPHDTPYCGLGDQEARRSTKKTGVDYEITRPVFQYKYFPVKNSHDKD